MNAQPKRRWYQFSLRTLLLAMLILGCLIAPIAYERRKAERYKAAVEKWKSLGCEIEYDDTRPNRPRLLAAVLGDNRFENVSSIHFYDQSLVNDDALSIAGQFSRLKWVRLDDTKVTDAALIHLKDCQRLTLLSLDRTRITDLGLVHIGAMTNLEELWLGRTEVSDAGILQMRSLKKLKTVALHRTNITDAGAEELQKALPNCKINR